MTAIVVLAAASACGPSDLQEAGRQPGAPAAAPHRGGPDQDAAAGGVIPDLDVTVLGDLAETWRPLPEVTERARQIARTVGGPGATARAWGDPTAGCFVVAAQADGGGAALHRALRDDLAAGGDEGAGPDMAGAGSGRALPESIAIEGWELDDTGARVLSRFRMTAGALRGRVSAISTERAPGRPVTLAVACFHGSREPVLCASACDRLLQVVEQST